MENTEKIFPKRKRTRLKSFDYSASGVYFVTICTQDKQCILSKIVGQGLAPAVIELSPHGKTAEKYILQLEQRYRQIKIEKYVIMPNHIHMLISIDNSKVHLTAGASPCPTLSDVICAFKSLTAIECRKSEYQEQKLFQTSFHDHIIRNETDFLKIWNYIDTNPAKWQEDCFYVE